MDHREINPASEPPVSPSAGELHELRQCEHIVQFRDAVFAGIHPRVQLPPQFIGKLTPLLPTSTQLSSSKPQEQGLADDTADDTGLSSTRPQTVVDNIQAFSENASRPAISSLISVPLTPVLPLEAAALLGPQKSASPTQNLSLDSVHSVPDRLGYNQNGIRDEIQLQRQGIEQAIKDEAVRVEKAEALHKASLSKRTAIDLDLSDILAKGLTLAQTKHKHHSTHRVLDQANDIVHESSANQSWDENTFYSSQYDTPDRKLDAPTALVQFPDQGGQRGATVSTVWRHGTDNRVQDPLASATSVPLRMSNLGRPIVPGLSLHTSIPSASRTKTTSRPGTQAGPSGGTISRNSYRQTGPGQSAGTDLSIGVENNPTNWSTHGVSFQDTREPVVSNFELFDRPISTPNAVHNPTPLRPQLSHTSIMRMDRHDSANGSLDLAGSRGEPAPLATPRPEHILGISSPESFSYGREPGKRNVIQRFKRKADRLPLDMASSQIKLEPMSISPVHGISYMQPYKRQRQIPRDTYDGYGASYEQTHTEHWNDFRLASGHASARMTSAHRNLHDGQSGREQWKEYIDGRRPESRSQIIQTPLPRPYSGPVQYEVINNEYVSRQRSQARESLRYPYDVGQNGMRTHARVSSPPSRQRERESSLIGPISPIAMPLRVVVDQFGREYRQPVSTPVVSSVGLPHSSLRRSAASGLETGDTGALVAGLSRRLGGDSYEDTPVSTFGPPSPAHIAGFVAPGRTVQQPNPTTAAYRSYRQPECSSRPVELPDDMIRVRDMRIAAPPDRRAPEEYDPRDHLLRATSVRPPPETTRYELPTEYLRSQTFRPVEVVQYQDNSRQADVMMHGYTPVGHAVTLGQSSGHLANLMVHSRHSPARQMAGPLSSSQMEALMPTMQPHLVRDYSRTGPFPYAEAGPLPLAQQLPRAYTVIPHEGNGQDIVEQRGYSAHSLDHSQLRQHFYEPSGRGREGGLYTERPQRTLEGHFYTHPVDRQGYL